MLCIKQNGEWLVGRVTSVSSSSCRPTAGDADTMELTPRKIGNVIALSRDSIGDSAVAHLDVVARAMVRGVATKVDARIQPGCSDRARRDLRDRAAVRRDDRRHRRAHRRGGCRRRCRGPREWIFLSPADVTSIRVATVNGGFATSHPTQPVVERIAGATLFATPALNAGEALVADTRYPVLAVRRDASVDFSEDALFTVDGVVARVTMRVDCVGDPEAFAVIGTPTLLATDRSDGQRAQRGCLRHRRRRHGSPRHGQAHKP